MNLRELICQATDELKAVRGQFYQHQASYDEMKAAAVKVLELRQQAERTRGAVRTKVNAQTIASLLRG